MNMMKHILTVAAVSLFLWTGVAAAADATKIGVVDFQKVLETSTPGKTAQDEINKQGKQMEADLKSRGAEIEDLEKKMDRESLVMSKDVREEKQRDLRIKLGDYKSLQQQYTGDFRALENRIIGKIQKEVVEVVQNIGKKDGYTLIVEKRTGGVVYAPTTIDITDEVIQAYNAMPPQPDTTTSGTSDKKKK